jgi:TRAP-type C4-dicarboxylate transport system permease small subunit
MDSLLAAWWRLLLWIGRLERVLGVALIALIVVSITVQVFTRYVFGQPLVWVEEAAGYAFLWSVFVGAGLGFKEVRHIRIDTFVVHLPRRPQAIARALIFALIATVAIVVATYAWDIMDVESRSNTMALPIELPRHLFYSTPLFVGLTSIAATAGYLILANLALAVSGRPVEADAAAHARRALME